MILAYYTYTNFIPAGKLDNLVATLSERNKSKWTSYKRREDQLLLLGSSALLEKILLDTGYSDYKLSDLKHTKEGRPFFRDAPFDFNIAHTESCAVVAFSEKGRVGIDIETIKEVNLTDFEEVFTKEVWEIIHASKNKYILFHHFWTLMESAIKADGRGLSNLSFQNIILGKDHVLLDGKEWFSHHQDFDPSIACCVTSNEQNETMEFREIRFI